MKRFNLFGECEKFRHCRLNCLWNAVLKFQVVALPESESGLVCFHCSTLRSYFMYVRLFVRTVSDFIGLASVHFYNCIYVFHFIRTRAFIMLDLLYFYSRILDALILIV